MASAAQRNIQVLEPQIGIAQQAEAADLGGLRGQAKAEFESRDYLAGMLEKAAASVQIFISEHA